MATRVSPPSPEQFGLSSSDVSDLPPLFVAPRRGLLCVLILVSLVVVATVIATSTTGSATAGLFFGTVLVVASLVLLLPLTMMMLCLAGQLEERWRSAHDPRFRACLRYRKALAGFQATPAESRETESQTPWLYAGMSRLRDLARTRLGRGADVVDLERGETGADILIDRPNRTTVVRCETGPEPTDVNIARELCMAQIDLGADDAILISPAGCTESLESYLKTHAILVLDSEGIVKLEASSE